MEKSLIAAAIFGFILGYIVQRSRFCMTSAIRDYLLFRVTTNLKFALITLTIITFTYTLMLTFNLFNPTPIPAGWYSFVGGLLFGIGMAIAGGCVISTFSRIGQGNINYVVTAIFMLIGIFVGSYLFVLIPGALPPKSGIIPRKVAGELTGPWPYKLFDIPPIAIGIILSIIFLALYIYLEKKEAI